MASVLTKAWIEEGLKSGVTSFTDDPLDKMSQLGAFFLRLLNYVLTYVIVCISAYYVSTYYPCLQA